MSQIIDAQATCFMTTSLHLFAGPHLLLDHETSATESGLYWYHGPRPEAGRENVQECRHARGRRGSCPYTAEDTAPEKPLSRWGVHDLDIVHC